MLVSEKEELCVYEKSLVMVFHLYCDADEEIRRGADRVVKLRCIFQEFNQSIFCYASLKPFHA